MRLNFRSPVAGLAIAASLLAAGAAQADAPSSNNFIGLGVGAIPKTPGNSSLNVIPLPVLQVSYEDKAYIAGTRSGAWAFDTEDKSLRIGLYAEPRFGYSGSDSTITRGMTTRDFAIDFGPTVRWTTEAGVVNLDYGFDVTGKSKGQVAQLQFVRPLVRQPGLVLNASVQAIWQSDKMNNYYWGVDSTETAPGRSAFSARSGTAFGAGLLGLYAFNYTGAMFFGATLTRLSGAQYDSPIAERNYVPTLYLGYGWRM
jgi:outer membrane scaffolding protein for murein synthesis (MipA/OmpV family)